MFPLKGTNVKIPSWTFFKSLLSAGVLALAACGLSGCAARQRTAAASGDLTIGFIYVGSKGRLRLQPGPRRGGRGRQEDAGRQGPGGGKGPRNGRCAEDHEEHDRARRRQADLPDVLRLLRPARARDGQGISRTSRSCTAAASGRRTSIPRTSAPISATSTSAGISFRHRGRPTPRSRRSSASSRPSRSRRCGATSTPSPSGAQRRSDRSPAPSFSPATGRCRSRRPRPRTA